MHTKYVRFKRYLFTSSMISKYFKISSWKNNFSKLKILNIEFRLYNFVLSNYVHTSSQEYKFSLIFVVIWYKYYLPINPYISCSYLYFIQKIMGVQLISQFLKSYVETNWHKHFEYVLTKFIIYMWQLTWVFHFMFFFNLIFLFNWPQVSNN